MPDIAGHHTSEDEMRTRRAYAAGQRDREAAIVADCYANPGGWLLPDPGPYSQCADEQPDDALRPADPAWPAHVRDAWESFRQARARVSGLIDACDRLQEEQAPGSSVAVAAQRASDAIHEADTAYLAYTEQWYAREPRTGNDS